MASITYASLDAYKAAHGGPVQKSDDDPMARFMVAGWFFTGQIMKDDLRPPLPVTQEVLSVADARLKVRDGWRPLKDRDGKIGVDAEIADLLRAYYGRDGAEVPGVIAELYLPKPRAAAAPPPAPPSSPAPSVAAPRPGGAARP